MLRTVIATRYVTPLREGGSLPAIVEADDLGLYVLKFRGAGQGPLALTAELVAGEIGREMGLRVPELVFIEVDAALGRNEPDEEIRDLLQASAGLNLGMDYLPGSVMFDPAAGDVADADIASAAVWFDAFVTNIDRTARNPNLLVWHKALYFIDHGAALYFHHNWSDTGVATTRRMAETRFAPIRDHVLLPWASRIAEADRAMRGRLNSDVFARVLDQVPDAWLGLQSDEADAGAMRAAYVEYFKARLGYASEFVEEAMRARAELI